MAASKDPKPSSGSAEDAEVETHTATSPDASGTTPSKKRKSSSVPEIAVDLSLPEPPSKKARRLIKKGKAPPPKPASSGGEDEDEDAGDKADSAAADKTKKKAKKERSPHGVWIGNLRFTVTKPELRKWLVDNSGGAIADEDITRVHLPTSKDKKGAAAAAPGAAAVPVENRGFAYVDFAALAPKVAAIALSETEWHRRKLLIKDSTSFEGRPAKEAEEPAEGGGRHGGKPGAGAPAPANTSRKVFVGNLGFATTEDDLWAHFDKCGEIEWVKVATFEDSGKCKGYGWVKFKEPEGAAWAAKGFVKIREQIETEEDFIDGGSEEEEGKEQGEKDGEDEEMADAAADGKKKETKNEKGTTGDSQQKTRTKKWWVNMLQGRKLKIEFAEDDQVRYNKRFRKGGANKGGDRPDGRTRFVETTAGGNATASQEAAAPRAPKELKFSQDVSVARLTGGVVASQGKKTTFD
ncbi:Nucleolar protein 13 [Pleurostoma richardsiae]|uniref:Nucleolar protein 13 n=1 Tax=Pleurostoma richardsiae TaxID=41990 RepID=A0AA38SDR7_9PEZI|nr:Nucleolar protein 13 [Pleurostoma richardsiae]